MQITRGKRRQRDAEELKNTRVLRDWIVNSLAHGLHMVGSALADCHFVKRRCAKMAVSAVGAVCGPGGRRDWAQHDRPSLIRLMSSSYKPGKSERWNDSRSGEVAQRMKWAGVR